MWWLHFSEQFAVDILATNQLIIRVNVRLLVMKQSLTDTEVSKCQVTIDNC